MEVSCVKTLVQTRGGHGEEIGLRREVMWRCLAKKRFCCIVAHN